MRSRFILAPAKPELQGPISAPRRNFLGRLLAFAAGGAVARPIAQAFAAPTSIQGENPFIGEILMVAFNFAPRGWAMCNGQLLSISQNIALFSLLGTTYGGNGQTTFALPDLRGRVPIHPGQGPGLTNRVLGEQSGEENHTLIITEMPAHNHLPGADSGNGSSADPTGRYPSRNPAGIPHYSGAFNANTAATSIAGGSQPHNNMQPFLAIHFIIALEGIFPSQS